MRRRNARAIGELFAREAGRLVAVSAGDGLETTMAAYGSGAVARSIRDGGTIINVDVGGGTAKLALCEAGRIVALTALDVGARLVALDADGRVQRIEESRTALRRRAGPAPSCPVRRSRLPTRRRSPPRWRTNCSRRSAGGTPRAGGVALLRLDPLPARARIDAISFSGGVSEYLYGGETRGFGDLGKNLAAEIRARLAGGAHSYGRTPGIRATVIGAAQYTIQVSGSTIYVAPLDALPLRNLPVVAPELALAGEDIDADAVAESVGRVLRRLDLAAGESPVALFAPWRGSATFDRLDAFCRGIVAGLAPVLSAGHPLVLAGDGDVGGLIGIHCREELRLANPIVSIDGLELKEFDYIDIGAIIATSGAVPVVIKSLIFPASAPP